MQKTSTFKWYYYSFAYIPVNSHGMFPPLNIPQNVQPLSKHTKTVVKRARQNIFSLRRLKRFGMGPQILKRFYSCTIESVLKGCITAWHGNCSASDRKALQRVVRTAQYITRAKLPDIQDLYTRRCQKGPKNCKRFQPP
jgi:hypothetical protein